jgi:hypothetical protein
MSSYILKLNLRLKNLCEIKSKLVKKVLKLCKGDMWRAKVHS